ncbi:MAG TPA: phosphosulfolactate synthase [Bacteroidetes bacterium]|nr:phosphosulfolactate synthase [Bacteroidota bacterium]
MNYQLSHLPGRTVKPRESGLTMVMDKGLSLREAENVVQASGDYIDLLKLGFGTSLITPNLKEKLKIYRDAGFKVYFGGTMFEAFVIRGAFDEYRKYLDLFDMEYAEVSDGSIILPHDKKLEYISKLSEQVTVLSEVGAKTSDIPIPDSVWVGYMKSELDAGSWKVIGEARESGTIGLYHKDGSANRSLIDDIIQHVDINDVIWEAPNKGQQAWFIKLLGANVNVGNIAPNEVISLEALRLGLRGDTFYRFLPEDMGLK